MISVVIVDDHEAVRVGLNTVIRTEPGLISVGMASDGWELAPLLYRTRPDVVLLDYRVPPTDGLVVCREIKSEVPAPAVVIYSAYADGSLVVPAVVAGADGIVGKSAAARELFEAIRTVARGEKALPPMSEALLEAAGQALEPEDLPILGMLVERTPPREIAEVMRLDPRALDHRIARMLARLKRPVPESVPAWGG